MENQITLLIANEKLLKLTAAIIFMFVISIIINKKEEGSNRIEAFA